MYVHCTSTAFYNPGLNAHVLYLAAAQISALRCPVLVLKLILEYPVSFLSCSNFNINGKEIPLHLCLLLVQTGIQDFS